MTGWRPRAPSLAGLIGWLLALVGFVAGCRPLSDNSLFTHLATGRLILDGGIPTEDPYSFTAPGEPWVVQSWLVSTVYALAERIAGLAAVRVLAGLLLGALLALAWRLTRPAGGLLVRVGLVVGVIGAGAPFWAPRPLLPGLVLFALVLVVTVERRDPRVLVPIMWVWVNSHGSYPLGVLAVACLCLGRLLDERADRPVSQDDDAVTGTEPPARAGPAELWRPLLWVVIGTLAGAVGPLGPRLLVFPVQLLGRMEILSRVVEWHSPSFDQLAARFFLAQLAVAILVLVRRPSFGAAVPLVAFTAVALVGQRSIPHASLVILPGMAVGLEGLGRLTGRERRPGHAVAGLALAVVALVGAGQVLAEPSVSLATYPVDALAWLDRQGALGVEGRVATTDTTGNLIELWRGTGARVFFDDRYDLYPLGLSRDYLALNDGAARWEEVLDRHGVRAILWPRGLPLAGLLASSPHWHIRYQDPSHLVACRRGDTPEADQC